MSIDNGGPAFPTLHIPDQSPPAWSGMSLRDYFAAKAMAVFLVDDDDSGPCSWTERMSFLSADAYAVADAMIASRGEA